MNAIAQALLAGAALAAMATVPAAMATVPAVAGNAPAFHVTALHAGNVVNKTKVHDPARRHLTYTFATSTSIPASDLNTKVRLPATFHFASYCSEPIKKVTPKRTQYAKIGIATETYDRCLLYGNTYKLTNPAGEGQTDHFVSTLIHKYQNGGIKYKSTLNIDVSVAIGQ